MRSILLLICSCILLNCTTERYTGPSTEEGNPVLIGTIVNADKKPAVNAKVNIYRISSGPDSLSSEISTAPEIGTLSDSRGQFEFYTLTPGDIVVEIISNNDSDYALIKDVTIPFNGNKIDIDTIVLSKPGSITGVVTRGGVIANGSGNAQKADGFIQVFIKEINRQDITNLSGNYELTDVPPGVYSLVFYSPDGFYTQIVDSIHVISGKNTAVNLVTLKRIPGLAPPKPFNLKCDYNTATNIVSLQWESYNDSSIIGFQIERRVNPLLKDTIYATDKMVFAETLSSVFSGKTLYYIVRSVNNNFMESPNEGPVSITIK